MKKGFTLIELLVVVLIIGILSAVALPQYNKAVNKSKAVEAWTVGKTFVDAEKVYLLETGGYTNNLDDLGIELPKELKNWDITMNGDSVTAGTIGCAELHFSGKGGLGDMELIYRVNGILDEGADVTCMPDKRCLQMLPCTVPVEVGTSGMHFRCFDL